VYVGSNPTGAFGLGGFSSGSAALKPLFTLLQFIDLGLGNCHKALGQTFKSLERPRP
jgi:hypothetical protein